MATLLLLDDDSRFRSLAASVLERRGHTVLQASRCAEAKKVLANRTVDLMVVDALLPDGTGPDFIRERRAARFDEPILLVSAFWKKELAAVAREAGAQASLGKPVTPEDLLRKVEGMVGSKDEAVLTPEAETELAEMRSRFAGELSGLVTGVRVAVDQLRAKPKAPGLFGVARRRAHQLAGIAGSFGFDAVGNSCAAIEEALVALQSGATDAWTRIDSALARLLPEPARASFSAA